MQTTPPTVSLARSAAKGNDLAETTTDFATLYTDLRRYLIAVAGRLGAKPCEREDIVQQAFMKLLETGRNFSRDHAKAYLAATVRTLLIDRGRRQNFRRTDLVEDWSIVESRIAAQDSDAAAHNKQLAALIEKLGQLETQGAEFLAWFYRDGMSVAEIGARAGVGTGTITSKLTRQRQRYLGELRTAVEAVA
jgi:RNA polymerase sigma factor (sigma-70 family)